MAASEDENKRSPLKAWVRALERTASGVRVVRLRPGLIFKREVGVEVRRLFLGPFFPNPLLRPLLIPLVIILMRKLRTTEVQL